MCVWRGPSTEPKTFRSFGFVPRKPVFSRSVQINTLVEREWIPLLLLRWSGGTIPDTLQRLGVIFTGIYSFKLSLPSKIFTLLWIELSFLVRLVAVADRLQVWLTACIYLLAEGGLIHIRVQSRYSYRQAHIKRTSGWCSWGAGMEREPQKFHRQFH